MSVEPSARSVSPPPSPHDFFPAIDRVRASGRVRRLGVFFGRCGVRGRSAAAISLRHRSRAALAVPRLHRGRRGLPRGEYAFRHAHERVALPYAGRDFRAHQGISRRHRRGKRRRHAQVCHELRQRPYRLQRRPGAGVGRARHDPRVHGVGHHARLPAQHGSKPRHSRQRPLQRRPGRREPRPQLHPLRREPARRRLQPQLQARRAQRPPEIRAVSRRPLGEKTQRGRLRVSPHQGQTRAPHQRHVGGSRGLVRVRVAQGQGARGRDDVSAV